MKKYSVSYTYQGEEVDFVYQHESEAFPNSEEMLHLAMINAHNYHDKNHQPTKVELVAISLIR